MTVKVFKVVLMIIDFDGLGAEQISEVLENQKYPNYCIHPSVMEFRFEETNWTDEHPLNNSSTQYGEFKKMFS